MSFFENIGKKVGEAAQAAAKKSGELVELGKLSLNIKSEEDKLADMFKEVGEKVYRAYVKDESQYADFKMNFQVMKASEEIISELKQR